MRGDERLGKENISETDRIIPRVQLLAAISQPVTDGLGEAGHFFHTITEEDLGDVVDITILFHRKQYTLWAPRHMGGGILARASDGVNWDNGNEKFRVKPIKDKPRYEVEWETGLKVGVNIGLGKWGTSDPDNEDSMPAATLTHVLICTSPAINGPFAVLLQRTGERVAKQLLTKIDLDRAPIFGQRYLMGSKVESNGSDDYHQYTFAKNGYVGEAEYAEYKKLHEQFKASSPKVDDSAADATAKAEDDDNGDTGGDATGEGARNDY